MFERYTEKARRTVFFARYEASHFGSPYIETEHLLLGLLREDKALANRFVGTHAAIEDIRKQIEKHTPLRPQTSVSVDLPLSHESKRVLAYGSEEAEQMKHKDINTSHLLLGLLREEKFYSAQLLHEHGLTPESVRQAVQQSASLEVKHLSPFILGVSQWLAQWEVRSGFQIANQRNFASRTSDFAIYAGSVAQASTQATGGGADEKLRQIQKRIDSFTWAMEQAIASHEFEKARLYSDEEKKERENFRSLREQFGLEELPPRTPSLCVEIIRRDGFTDVQKWCDEYLAAGVAEIWILDPNSKRACIATKADGLREFKGDLLRLTELPLELDLRKVFA